MEVELLISTKVKKIKIRFFKKKSTEIWKMPHSEKNLRYLFWIQ